MTTPASGRKLTSACNGVTTVFGCPVFEQAADLLVYLLNAIADPNSAGTLLVQGVDYAIAGSGPAGTATITTTVAYPNGKYIRRYRKTSRAQTVHVVAGQGLPAATQEGALDRLSLIDEELDDDIASIPGNAPIGGQTLLGNKTLATAPPVALTANEVVGFLPAFTGDAGAGGAKGIVPAPGVGDAAADKWLHSSGVWKAITFPAGGPGGGGGVTTNKLSFNNGGAGAASGAQFDGSGPVAVSSNTIGAAPVNSPAFTGNPTAPTPAPGDNDTSIATTAFVAAALAALVNAAPGTLDTLKELADALGDDPNYAATTAAAIALKGDARPGGSTPNASFAAADAHNNTDMVMSGAGTPTITLGNITARTAFTARVTTNWAIACAGGLSKNGAAPGGITAGNIAANSLVTFFHEGGGVWRVSSNGLT